MELNYNDGTMPFTAVFDTNNDGTINSNDVVVSGLGYQAISSSPTILTGLGVSSSPINMVYTNQSNGIINTALTSGSRLSSRKYLSSKNKIKKAISNRFFIVIIILIINYFFIISVKMEDIIWKKWIYFNKLWLL